LAAGKNPLLTCCCHTPFFFFAQCDYLDDIISTTCGAFEPLCQGVGKLFCVACELSECTAAVGQQICGLWDSSCSNTPLSFNPKYSEWGKSDCSGSSSTTGADLTSCQSGRDIRGSVRGMCTKDGKTVYMTQYESSNCQGSRIINTYSVPSGQCQGSQNTFSGKGSAKYECSGALSVGLSLFGASLAFAVAVMSAL